jgi:hypothetical protein
MFPELAKVLRTPILARAAADMVRLPLPVSRLLAMAIVMNDNAKPEQNNIAVRFRQFRF